MGSYKIFETKELIKNIDDLAIRQKIFVEKKLLNYIYPQLREEPHYGNNIKKLSGYKPETWRCRLGKFRLFYTIDENTKIIFVLSLYERKNAY